MKPEKNRVKIDTVESGNWRVNTIHCQYTFQLQLHNQFVWFIMSSFHSSHSHHHLHPVHSQTLQLNCAFSVLYLTNIHTPGIQTHNTYILYLTLPSVPSLLKYCGDEWSVSLSLCLCQRESRSRKTRRARLWTADEEPSNRPRSTSSRTMSSLPRSSDSRRSALCAGILSGQWLCLQHRINKIYRQHEFCTTETTHLVFFGSELTSWTWRKEEKKCYYLTMKMFVFPEKNIHSLGRNRGLQIIRWNVNRVFIISLHDQRVICVPPSLPHRGLNKQGYKCRRKCPVK